MSAPPRLRPSNAPRWSKCPGSYVLQGLFPDDEESEEAREGTAAHYWSSEALNGNVLQVGALAPNGYPIDADMIDAGQVYLEDIYKHLALASPQAQFRVEQFLTMHGLVHPLNEGTTDAYLIDPTRHVIRVWDFKYGHRDRDPFRDPQGLDYIAGVLEAYELTLDDVKGWDITFCVVQPRNFRAEAVREWRMLGWQAWEAIEELSAQACAATTTGAQTVTGPWCYECSAQWNCEAARRMAGTACDLAATNIPVELTPEAIGRFLHHLTTAAKRLEGMKTALEEVALSSIRGGKQIPHWTIGHGEAREKWTVPAAEVIALGEMFGANLAKPLEAITPPQARKLLGVDATVISAYSEKPKGAAKLVAVDETTAAKAFS